MAFYKRITSSPPSIHYNLLFPICQPWTFICFDFFSLYKWPMWVRSLGCFFSFQATFTLDSASPSINTSGLYFAACLFLESHPLGPILLGKIPAPKTKFLHILTISKMAKWKLHIIWRLTKENAEWNIYHAIIRN